MSRLQLDSNRSNVSDASAKRENAYERLAEIFNDRTDGAAFQPTNRACKYINGMKTNEPSDSGKISSAVCEQLYDLDPNEAVRPIRSGQWLKDKYSEMKTDISKVADNYFRSGN
jgi:hypothetical protein